MPAERSSMRKIRLGLMNVRPERRRWRARSASHRHGRRISPPIGRDRDHLAGAAGRGRVELEGRLFTAAGFYKAPNLVMADGITSCRAAGPPVGYTKV